mmetsp:Transcript_8519/g.10386  ORF Transcript_8519/g.10386 Transcript_8519/m.10386 type:complete len:565 (+) Transcript_8519:167-1861(+)
MNMSFSVDWESLLEFEESLSSSFSKTNALLLHNLELKIELNRSSNCDLPANDYGIENLENDMNDYDYCSDEFTTCSKCGQSLYDDSAYKTCCKAFVSCQRVISSNLEKSFWISFINNPSSTINTLPNYTELLFLRQGLPVQLRSMTWKKLFLIGQGNVIPETSKLVFDNFQHSYSLEISKQISKDLSRTFPLVNFFKNEETIKNLSTILNVYANYDVELGYCQGLLFLVGVLYYHFKSDSTLTFHALVTIMESEPELHDIFTSSTMSYTLSKWKFEFASILQEIDNELYEHLNKFVDMQVFLYQWWLSFISTHTPDLSIVNRVMDFCLLQGWKIGMFKISLGLLLMNKPILMTLDTGDEEVIYQHLLNESKWGIAVKDLNAFFGDLLLSWEDSVFMELPNYEESLFQKPIKSHKRTPSAMMSRFKNLSINLSRNRSNSSSSQIDRYSSSEKLLSGFSSVSVFSTKLGNRNDNNCELDSIYSDITTNSELSSLPPKSFSDNLKIPYYTKCLKHEQMIEDEESTSINNGLLDENIRLKILLKRAYDMINDNEPEASALKCEISEVV